MHFKNCGKQKSKILLPRLYQEFFCTYYLPRLPEVRLFSIAKNLARFSFAWGGFYCFTQIQLSSLYLLSTLIVIHVKISQVFYLSYCK